MLLWRGLEMIKMMGKEIKKRWTRVLPELKDLDSDTEYEFETMGDLIEIVRPTESEND